jgi:NADH-quinone oxidoreductase subunit M
LAIAGMPPLAIFASEWMIFAGGFHTGRIALAVASLFGSLLTVVYALRFGSRLFLGDLPDGIEVSGGLKARSGLLVRQPGLAMVLPTVLLAILTIVAGLIPGPMVAWVSHELAALLGGTG